MRGEKRKKKKKSASTNHTIRARTTSLCVKSARKFIPRQDIQRKKKENKGVKLGSVTNLENNKKRHFDF